MCIHPYIFLYIYLSFYLSWVTPLHRRRCCRPGTTPAPWPLARPRLHGLAICISIYLSIYLSISGYPSPQAPTLPPWHDACSLAPRAAASTWTGHMHIHISIYLPIYIGLPLPTGVDAAALARRLLLGPSRGRVYMDWPYCNAARAVSLASAAGRWWLDRRGESVQHCDIHPGEWRQVQIRLYNYI